MCSDPPLPPPSPLSRLIIVLLMMFSGHVSSHGDKEEDYDNREEGSLPDNMVLTLLY